jgi:PDZ domain-containing protein
VVEHRKEHLDSADAVTDETIVPPGTNHRRRLLLGISGTLAVVVIVLGLLIPLPYYILSPGTSRPTETLISVTGAETFENSGEVDFLTVSLRKATPVELFAAWVNPDLDVTPEEKILGKQTVDENRELNIRLMADSKDAAQYQALNRLGYAIESKGTGAVVASVVDDGPSAGLLVPGDVITRINDQEISYSQQLISVVSANAPGATLSLSVEPFDELISGARPARDVQVVLGARTGDPSKGFLGVSTFTRDLSFNFPVQVSIDSGRVGGPSAGLAFTLGILDVMTPGSLTGGLRISSTGTMSLDGSVGPVGGVHQKVMASRRAGIDLMFVPASEIEEARRFAGDLRVEPVETLDQALEILTTLGGGNAVLPPAGGSGSLN